MFIQKSKFFLLGMAFFFCVGFTVAQQALAQSSTPDSGTWATDGEVYSVVTTGNRAYIGGSFTYVGQSVGSGFPVSLTTGQLLTVFPKFNSTVRTVVDDGAGGWYVGGDFYEVDGVDIQYLAHVLANGSLDTSWQPQPNSSVYALALSGDRLYVGGNFTQFGIAVPVTRNYLASFDTATGNLTTWDPSPNNLVTTIAATGTKIYIGGHFNLISSESLTRNYFAAFDTTTGSSTSWNPDANSNPEVMILSEDGTTVYTGGNFTNIGGNARNYLAALNLTNGSSTAWDPAPDNQVTELVENGGVIYVGGSFSTIGSEARSYLAAVDKTTATSTSWAPNPDSSVYSLALNGSTLYVGGYFTNIGGQERFYIGAVDTITGDATSWNPNVNSSVTTMAFNAGRTALFLGGEMFLANGVWRDYLAEIDLTTGRATTWNANADSYVRALAFNPDQTILYVGGSFSNIGGGARNMIAALTRSTGLATSWDPSADNAVYALAVAPSGSPIYVGGDFTTIAGEAIRNLAAIDSATATSTGWMVFPTDWIRSLALNDAGTKLFAGEYRRRCPLLPLEPAMGGLHIAALPPICTYAGAVEAFDTDSSLTFWSNILGNGVYALALADDETTVYAGGSFANPGVLGASNYLLAMDVTDGTISSSWAPDPDSTITALMMNGRDLFVSGNFNNINSTARNYAAVIAASDASVGTWNPNLDGGINSFAGNNSLDKLLTGGAFWSIDGELQNSFAAYVMPVVEFSQANGSGSQSVMWPTVTVRLSRIWTEDVIVDYAVTGGTAVSGQNYTLSGTSVTIPAGATSVTIPLRILTQNSYQPTKTVVISLSNQHNALLGSNSSFTYQIESGGGGGGGGGGGTIYEYTPISGPGSLSQQNEDRLDRIEALPVPVHSLVKLADDGDPDTQVDSAVYYVGADGYRHAFPNSKAYFSWYCDYAGVQIITPDQMSMMGLGANVIYRPGIRMVKFQTSPVVYAVARYGVLRPIASEEVAIALYGSDWNTKIDDIADTFFGDYTIGEEIKSADQFNPSAESVTVEYISDTFSIVGYVPSGIGKPLICTTQATATEGGAWPFSFADTYRFNVDLYPFNTNAAANRNLQEFLAEQGADIYAGGITGNYGSITTQGVRNFQAKYDISQTGNLGPLTREKVNQMLNNYSSP